MANPTISEALGSSKSKYVQVINMLFNARTNTHIAHLQTKSFAAHKALNEFYDGIIGIADSFAEASQVNGILTGYDLGKLYTGSIESYLKGQYTELLNMKSQFKEGHLLQLIDDATELYASTIYKLTMLS